MKVFLAVLFFFFSFFLAFLKLSLFLFLSRFLETFSFSLSCSISNFSCLFSLPLYVCKYIIIFPSQFFLCSIFLAHFSDLITRFFLSNYCLVLCFFVSFYVSCSPLLSFLFLILFFYYLLSFCLSQQTSGQFPLLADTHKQTQTYRSPVNGR